MSCKTCLFSRPSLHWLLPFKGQACQLWVDWLCCATTINVLQALICYLSIAFFIWLLQYLKWFYNSMSEAKGWRQWVESFILEYSNISCSYILTIDFFNSWTTKRTAKLKRHFLLCQRRKINPNFKILFCYWSPFKSRLIFTHWQGKKKMTKLGSSLEF